MYDVVIVGYGPVGQALALALGRRGHRVAVLERHPGLYGRARAGHIDGEIMRLFQGLGVAEDLEPLLSPVHNYELVDADWRVLRRIDAGAPATGWQNDYLFYQPDLEDVLHKAVEELPSVRVHQSREVTAITQHPDHVEVTARESPSGATETFSARYLVGADGARSFVRGAAAITSSDLGLAPTSYLVIDIKHRDPGVSIPRMGELRQVLDPTRPRHASRWNGSEHSRTEFMILPGESFEELESTDRCWQLLERYWGVSRDSGELVRHAVYTFETTLADHWRRDRILLAGDAAHVMPPFLGQGLCSGLRDVANLTWRLDLVLRQRAKPELLDDYQTERHPHAKRLIQASAQIAEQCTILDPEAALARNTELAAEQQPHSVERNLLSGTLAAATPNAGELFIQGRVHHGGRNTRLDDLLGNGWRILTRHPIPDELIDPSGRAVLDALDITLAHVTRGRVPGALLDIDATYDQWFTHTGNEIAIERPDHYLYGAGQTTDLPALLTNLARQTHCS